MSGAAFRKGQAVPLAVSALVARDGGALVRHLACLVAMGVSFAIYRRSGLAGGLLWALGAAGAANLSSYALFAVTGRGRCLSPVLGIASWSVLIGLTGGSARSPFVGGLWLEILLAATSPSVRALASRTALAVAGLWMQELVLGLSAVGALAVQSALLLLLGTVTWTLQEQWRTTRRCLSRSVAERSHEILGLREELEDERRVGVVGAEAARSGHRLKNAVHCLRGYASLLAEEEADRTALYGLNESIERIDALVRSVLARGRETERAEAGVSKAGFRRVVEETVGEVSRAYPAVRFETRLEPPPEEIGLSGAPLGEVLVNLLLNAAEAMDGRGRVTIESSNGAEEWRLRVRDRGVGVPAHRRREVFRPGHTTKANGSGIGLYVCARLVELQGGRIFVEEEGRGERGASFAVAFPVRSPP